MLITNKQAYEKDHLSKYGDYLYDSTRWLISRIPMDYLMPKDERDQM